MMVLHMYTRPTDWCEYFAPLFINRELYEWTRIFDFSFIRKEIGREGAILFIIHTNDHYPKHLHVKYQSDEVVISIPMEESESFKLIRGTLPHKKMKDALNWCEKHRDEIIKDWDKLRVGVFANN